MSRARDKAGNLARGGLSDALRIIAITLLCFQRPPPHNTRSFHLLTSLSSLRLELPQLHPPNHLSSQHPPWNKPTISSHPTANRHNNKQHNTAQRPQWPPWSQTSSKHRRNKVYLLSFPLSSTQLVSLAESRTNPYGRQTSSPSPVFFLDEEACQLQGQLFHEQ